MNVVYQKDTTFADIALQIANTPQKQGDNTQVNTQQPQLFLKTPNVLPPQPTYALTNSTHNNKISDVPITRNIDHVISPNANDVIDLANMIDQVVSSQGAPRKLMDSMHTPEETVNS